MSDIATTLVANDLDAGRLDRWMADHVSGYRGPLSYEKFSGGQSNPTYRIDSDSGSYVLRRKPFGQLLPSAHAIEREYRLIAALHPVGYPVAKPHGLCEDSGVIGAPFYVMEMVRGRSLWIGTLPGMTPHQRTDHYHAILDTLAALHAIDPEKVGLSDFGRPGNYFERQVSRWTKQYRMSETETLDSMERLIDYLPRTVPPQTRTAIVHGDFRIDNMIFAQDSAEVVAVLDWELSTLGDPLADLSYLLMNWETAAGEGAGVLGCTGAETGIPTIEQMVDRYCRATGRAGIPELDWYFSYNLFRLAAIIQGIKKRMLDGNASNAAAEKAVARLPGLADSAWTFAQRAGAV